MRLLQLLDLLVELINHQLDALPAIVVLDVAARQQLLAVGLVVHQLHHQFVHGINARLLSTRWRRDGLHPILEVLLELLSLVHEDNHVACEILG